MTLHPFVVNWYCNTKQAVLHKSYCVISDDLRHDANTFHVFRTEVMQRVLIDLEHLDIKKVYYVSDGAGSQYKNYKNFANLMFHQNEYDIPAEWVFTATSHGKSTCDAIGAVTKCATRRESLKEGVIIMNAKEMFDFCVKKFSGKAETLEYVFCTREDVELQRENLEDRYKEFNKLPGIRKNHVFVPMNDGQLRMYRTAGQEIYAEIDFRKGLEVPALPFSFENMIVGEFYAFKIDRGYHVGMYVAENEVEGDATFQTLKLNRNTGICSWPEPAIYLEIPLIDIFLRVEDPKDQNGLYVLEDIKNVKAQHRQLRLQSAPLV